MPRDAAFDIRITLRCDVLLTMGMLFLLSSGFLRQLAAQPTTDARTGAIQWEQAFEQVIEKSSPAIVSLQVVSARAGAEEGSRTPWSQTDLFGSGVLIRGEEDSRFVLTNAHLVQSLLVPSGKEGGRILAVWSDRQRVPVSLQAADPRSDLAILRLDLSGTKLKASELPGLNVGQAEGLKRGRMVVCLGNPYAMAWDVPFVGVNHLEAHLYAAFLEEPDLSLPLVVLLASGGHTLLVLMEGRGQYRLLGQTIDDAAGEAFDKVARVLGLGYPGGPAIEAAAVAGDPTAISFPQGLRDAGYDFSFSGVKTSVVTYLRKHPDASAADVAASFQEAVVDVLVAKASRAAAETGARGICIGGGVAANSRLRERIMDICAAAGLRAFVPSRAMCTDNAAMVAAAGWWRLQSDGPTGWDCGAFPSLRLPVL